MSDPQGTFAWLVVILGSGDCRLDEDWPVGSPLYKSANGWTHDVLQALRYARRGDARFVADVRNSSWPFGTRATFEEHGFAPVHSDGDDADGDDDPPNEGHYM